MGKRPLAYSQALDTGKFLDLNQRINLRGLIEAWAKITVERHLEDVSEKVYGSRTSKKGVQRSALGKNYRFGSGRSRTNALRSPSNWRASVSGSDEVVGAQYSFLMYGRFIEMGVGRGTDFALARYQGVRKNGEPRTRRPVPWYSKRKAAELHRLRELMAQHYVDIPLSAIENALSTKVIYAV